MITRAIPLWVQNLMLNAALERLDDREEIRQSDITHLMAHLANKK